MNKLTHTYPVRWVKLKRMCELTGETQDTLRIRRNGTRCQSDPDKSKDPAWIEGVHWQAGPDGVIRYNLEEYDKWAQTPTRLSAVA